MTAKYYAETDAHNHKLTMYRTSGTYLAVTADNMDIGGEHVAVWLTLDAAQQLDAALAEDKPFEFVDHSGDRLAVAPAYPWTTFEITRAEREDDEPSTTVRVVLLSARVPQLRRSLADLLDRETPARVLLAQARKAAREFLAEQTGERRPMWRAVRTFHDAVTGVAPVCTSERSDALHATHDYRLGEPLRDEQGVYACCPLPIIETDSAPMAAYLVELLNADGEDGARTEPRGAATSYPPALPWARLMDADDLAEFLAEVEHAIATPGTTPAEALAAVEKACGTWRLIGEAQHAHNTAPGPNSETGEQQ